MSVCLQNEFLNLPDEIYQEILSVFLSGQAEVIQTLEEAIRAVRAGQPLNLVLLQRLSHQRRGEAGMMGLIPFQQVYTLLQKKVADQTIHISDLEEIADWIRVAIAGLEDLERPVASSDALLARLA